MSDPTQSEIAALAATLAGGNPNHDPGTLARAALRLWHATGKAIADDAALKARIAEAESRNPLAGIDVPKKFPVKLDKFLLAILQGRDSADRLPIFKRYLSSDLRADKTIEAELAGRPTGNIPKTTEAEILAVIERYRRDGFTRKQFEGCAEMFLKWFQTDQQQRQAEAGRKAGKASAAKRAKGAGAKGPSKKVLAPRKKAFGA